MAMKAGERVRRRRGRKDGSHDEKVKTKKLGADGEKNGAKGRKSLLIQFTDDAPTWYVCGKQTPGRDATIFTDPPSSSDPKNKSLVSQYRAEADELYRQEVQLFNASSGQSSSDDRWVENTMKRGTLKDRIAAMSVLVSTNPVHKLYSLDGLLQMAGCSENGGQTNARMAQMAAEALEDLFLNTFLPKDRKLIPLEKRPLYRYESNGQITLSPRVLLLWRYEEMIKEKYQAFLRHYLALTLRDGMEMSKLHGLRLAGALLRSAPEAEDQLLSMMVNKLGDPAKKTAAAAGHELRRVLEQHANMQVVIAREVQQLAHRPHLSPRALYNCIIFLNQLELENDEEIEKPDPAKKGVSKPFSLPASLINTYFRLFEVAVNRRAEDDTNPAVAMKSRLLSALLTGVNRAHPYLPAADKDLDAHIDSLYRVVHTAPPAASTQALMLLFLVIIGAEQEKRIPNKIKAKQDRFYRALYSTLSHSSLVSSGKHLTMYFNLLYKAMKNDSDISRVNAFAKRLLCTTMHSHAPVAAASLFLLNEIMKYHSELLVCFTEVLEGSDALAVLDSSKREPVAALVPFQNGSSDGNPTDPVKSASLWEMSLLTHHFHPSVAKFAATLSDISYAGDPLHDFSLAPFLDKFAYRNPKTAKHTTQPTSVVAKRRNIQIHNNTLPVNDPSFREKGDVGEQDEFFHKFFVERARRDEIKGIVRGKNGMEDNEEADAIDIAENVEFDHNLQFDDEGWDTDPEEEAFVDALALKLMDDAEDGEAGLDDEDPDMEGWDDMYSDAGEDNDETTQNIDEDEDGFMDEHEDDSSSEDDDGSDLDEGEEAADEDAFMDAADDYSSEEDENGSFDADDNSVSDEDENDLALVAASDDEEVAELEQANKKKSKKDNMAEPLFADASEYEEIISKSWRNKSDVPQMDGDAADEPEHSSTGVSASKKKRKRKKRKRSPSE